jgi:hypothetical protein
MAREFCGVTLDNTGQIVLPSAGAAIYGVLQTKPTAGQTGTVWPLGMTKMVVGTGGVTSGDKVMVDSSGRAVTATSTNYQIGWAEDTAAAGQLTTVVLLPLGKQ